MEREPERCAATCSSPIGASPATARASRPAVNTISSDGVPSTALTAPSRPAPTMKPAEPQVRTGP